MNVLCGTCAWADHHAFFPKSIPASQRLAYYARYFRLVEVDSSYYRIPEPEHVAHWIEQTPDDFVFDLKAYRTLTGHDRGATAPEQKREDTRLFSRIARQLHDSGKLGQILFQFPPWFSCTEDNRTEVVQTILPFEGMQAGVEFRHRSWWEGRTSGDTLHWLRDHGYVNVVCDEPQTGSGTIPFVPEVTQSRLVVFRLHGRNADTWYQSGLASSQQRFDYLYDRTELSTFLPWVQQWAEQAQEIHILMNNNQADYAIRNAVDWLDLLNQRGPRPVRQPLSEQLTLFDEEIQP